MKLGCQTKQQPHHPNCTKVRMMGLLFNQKAIYATSLMVYLLFYHQQLTHHQTGSLLKPSHVIVLFQLQLPSTTAQVYASVPDKSR